MTDVFFGNFCLQVLETERDRKWECGSSETLVLNQDNVHSSNLRSRTAPVISSLSHLCAVAENQIGVMGRKLYFSDGVDL